MSEQEGRTDATLRRGYEICRQATSRWHVLALALSVAAFLYMPTSPAAASGQSECADESLRSALNSSALPECRVYEMVSPVYKEGYSLTAESFASNGTSMIVYGIGALAGNPGSGEQPVADAVYVDRRTDGGWQLTPLNAPLSEFVGELPLASEANNGETLWEQHTPAQPATERGLYIRSSSGVFSFVGPLSPKNSTGEEPSNLIDPNTSDTDSLQAATSNYGHVILEARHSEARWPFDETPVDEAHPSLYEYSGLMNREPTLVEVVGEKGSRQLIAGCGAMLGSGTFGSSFNALSSDGEGVFFTVQPCSPGPATAEVYARLHGAATSVTAAETVDVSASECTVACGENESAKEFEGASEDGKRVFFTSTQKLTNEAVDGTAGGNAAEGGGCPGSVPSEGGCNLYRYDFGRPAGARLKTVSVGGEVLGVVGIARDGSYLYYVSRAAIGSAGRDVYARAPIAGQPNLYAYDASTGQTAFVATLGGSDGRDWNKQFNRPAEDAGDGLYLLFKSSLAGVTPDDHSEQAQLFEYRLAVEGKAAALVRVTKGENGFNEDGNGVTRGIVETSVETNALGDLKSTTNRSSISVDGRTVFFLAKGQLSQRATSVANGCRNLYEFHTEDALSSGSVHLVSDGRDTQLFKGGICGPQLQGVDDAGTNVLFTADDPLVPSDTDGVQRDIYDARVNGGFGPAPSTGACDVCEGIASGPPLASAGGSTNEVGEAPVATIGPAAGPAPPPMAAGGVAGGGAKVVPRKQAGGSGLAGALRACRHKPRTRRASCMHDARRRFGKTAGVSRLRRGK